jgi:checkpoint serine/threonine-protein kinase
MKFDSPSNNKKVRRKSTREPTMTMHTRAATDEIYSIFNQPLKAETEEEADSFCGSDYEDDDCDGDSTGTGHISAASSDFADEETQTFHKSYDDTDYANTTRAESVDGDGSDWTEFNPDRDIPDIENAEVTSHSVVSDEAEGSSTQGTPERKGFVPEMPEDYAPPWGTYRDPAVMAQNRLPFMTPIVERTESIPSLTTARKSIYNTKTPSKPRSPDNNFLLSSPLGTNTPYGDHTVESAADVPFSPMAFKALAPKLRRREPIIRDAQCNPTDKGIRNTILNSLEKPLATYTGYHGHVEDSNYASMIQKFVKTSTRRSKSGGDDAFDTPILEFPGAERSYIIRRELGAGAYAPVYLAESVDSLESYDSDSDDGRTPNGKTSQLRKSNAYETPRFPFEAVKVENGPSSAWEFYMIRTAYSRLRQSTDHSRAIDSLVRAHELHVHQRESFLVEDYRGQGTILDLVNFVRNETINPNHTSEGGLEEVLAMFFSVELFRTVEALHANGVLHGDIKADNCLVRLDEHNPNEPPSKALSLLDLGADETAFDPRESIHYSPSGSYGWQQKGLALIDFGRSIDMQAFSPGVQFIADWETGTHECNEIREMRPWTHHIDLYGIAGVIHVLLFGKYIESTATDGNSGNPSSRTYRIRESLKRYWDRELWAGVFDLLLNPGAERWQRIERENGVDAGLSSAPILPVLHSMRYVRRGMEEWLLANAEKKGLALQIRKIEALLAERKKKLEK